MSLKKTAWIVLAAALLCAVPLFPMGISASASTTLTTENASLFLPGSYEQYISLSSPVDIAKSERYLVIAEEQILYIYDYQAESATYRTYTHTHKISKIQFSADGELFFSDERQEFYKLDLAADPFTPSESLTHLTTFYIQGDTLFKVLMTDTGTSYLATPISEPKNDSVQFGDNESKNTPLLTSDNGNFYTVVGKLVDGYTYNETLKKYESTATYALQGDISKVTAACAINGTLYLVINGNSADSNGIYGYDLSTQTGDLLLSGNGYGALTSYGGKLYAVKGNGVIEYAVGDGLTPTGYEISAASDAVGRLSGAKDIAHTGGLLVIVDSENQRISIVILDHDEEADSSSDISVIPCLDCDDQPYTPNLVATDGEIIAVASLDEKKSSIYLYRFGIPEYVSCHSLEEPVIGLTCVDGECYFITENGYGKAQDGFKTFCRSGENPVALTADDCENIYVVDAGGCMQKYTADEFANCEIMHGIEQEMTFPSTPTSLQIDGKGEFYYMRDKKLYMNETELFDLENHSLIYGEIGDPSSFAVDFDCGEIYLLYPYYIIRIRLGTDGR